jgi:O-acetylhomoserine (thiol)-lyase
MTHRYSRNTVLVHGTYKPEDHNRSRAVPIYQTAGFTYDSADHAAALFGLTEPGFIYSRLHNPTVEEAEQRLCLLEGGVGAVAFASGMAAMMGLMLNVLRPGDEVLAASCLYGGTIGLLRDTLSNFGIKTHFFDPLRVDDLKRQLNSNARMIVVENLANPRLLVPEHEAISAVAKENGILYVVDNTVGTPYLTNPRDYGADIVVHSCTKYLDGHGNILGGIVVDSGTFEWNQERYPLVHEAAPSGQSFVEQFGPLAFVTRMRSKVLMNTGGCMAPFSAFLLNRGMETLHVRMERHCENAATLARFLEGHPCVSWVSYPGLESHPAHSQAKRYLRVHFGGMLGFGIQGGYEAGKRFINQVALLCHSTNIGDTKTLVIHPASTTHRNLTAAERESAGIGDDFIRLSAGLEDVRDLELELDRALKLATAK